LKRNKLHTLSEPALTHPEDLDSWERLLEDMRQSKQDKVQTTKRYVREDGETVWTKVSVGSVLNRQKQVEYFVLHIEDIHELREAQEIAMQSSKLAAVGETAASLVHELKAPLGAIRLKSEMCKRSLEMDKPVPAKKFDEIIRIVDKTNEILQHMRNFTRRSDHTQKGPVSIEEVLQETLLLLRPEFNRLGIRLETQLTPHLPHIFANNIQVEQVLINLLHNARDALEEQATKQITVRLKPAGEQVVLEIQDSGCGMSPEVQQKIFESFYTTKAVGKGTGLGMSIVRRILLEHDASIEVESAVGEGTTFQICFPIAAIIQHKLAAARSA
jgi:C4-dicarboxylate-specific signal transduction histidine kinase